ncbi:hypothetical protein BC831DRAFT_440761 [Entophlyctis helioformis]|nr:hypothetical protein BC831DRAFT_440761 [Entophlyctis helioformis]
MSDFEVLQLREEIEMLRRRLAAAESLRGSTGPSVSARASVAASPAAHTASTGFSSPSSRSTPTRLHSETKHTARPLHRQQQQHLQKQQQQEHQESPQPSSSMMLAFEHPLLSLQLSSIHAPSDILPPSSPRMMLEELGPPDGNYAPLFGASTNSRGSGASVGSGRSGSFRSSRSGNATPRPDSNADRPALGSDGTAAAFQSAQHHRADQHSLPMQNSSSSQSLFGSATSKNTSGMDGSSSRHRSTGCNDSGRDGDDEASYEDVLRNVQRVLAVDDRPADRDHRLYFAEKYQSTRNESGLAGADDGGDSDADGIDSLLSSIQQAIGSDSSASLQSSFNNQVHASARYTSDPRHAPPSSQPPSIAHSSPRSDYGKASCASSRTSTLPVYHIPRIEYVSLVEDDSLLERASDPIMSKYLPQHMQDKSRSLQHQQRSTTPSQRQSHHQHMAKQPTPAKQVPTAVMYSNMSHRRHATEDISMASSASQLKEAASSLTADFEDQLSMASLEYLRRHSLQPHPSEPMPTEQTTRLLDLDRLHRLPKLK